MEYKKWEKLLNDVIYKLSKREDVILVEGYLGYTEVHLVSEEDFNILKEHMYFEKSITMDNVYSILGLHQITLFRKNKNNCCIKATSMIYYRSGKQIKKRE